MSKKYDEKTTFLEKKEYPLTEAVEILGTVSTTSFDGTAEVHVRLYADPTQGDQQVRSTVTLPHGTGKDVKIAAVVPDDLVKDVTAAGAHKAGNDDLIGEIDKGKLDFDIIVAVPTLMKSLGKVARVLGQKGLMPNPKAGTVTDDPVKVIGELQKGKIEFRADKQGIIHSVFGKLSFGTEKLTQNLQVLLSAIKEARPSGIKGEYIRSIVLAPSMGPGVRVEVSSA